ncbi:hypothetical protein SPI_05601 [Niveomyces insectorum RCEF 264]|uniref:Uncharacterized protein n=1 Tax=Niveomyces insectorum RCEF 264 TaxID=1081102 RepID=A0A167TD45_9HYPO|nr:hypothetical protein SPI_05601 [Niveomyces insectorum RCEF 264]
MDGDEGEDGRPPCTINGFHFAHICTSVMPFVHGPIRDLSLIMRRGRPALALVLARVPAAAAAAADGSFDCMKRLYN